MSSYPELKEFIEEEQTYDSLFEKDKYTILYFTASWCGPCKMIAPRVQQLAERNPNVNFYKIDVDEFEELTASAGINCMPTFLLFKNNAQVGILEGADQNALTDLVLNNL